MAKTKKDELEQPMGVEDPSPTPATPTSELGAKAASAQPKMVTISEDEWQKTQDMLKMLYETADKGRIFNYESQRTKKQPMRVNLSVFRDGGIITGWRTIKDKAVYHPTTGKQIGEEQQYEILVMDKEGKINPVTVDGYPNFTAARYGERIECEVVSKRDDFEGNVTFDVKLPDGRTIPLGARFVN